MIVESNVVAFWEYLPPMAITHCKAPCKAYPKLKHG